MMRPWLLLSFVACAEPLRPPRQLPPDPNAVNGCRSAPTKLGGVRYTCTSYQLIDSVVDAASIRTLEREIVKLARARGFESTTSPADVDGADAALLIAYEQGPSRAFDLLATQPLGAKVRAIQCHVPWFDNPRSLPTRQDTCVEAIGTLLKRPPPPGRELSADCKRATARLPTLPGRTEPADNSEELRVEMRDFAARCTDRIAACALVARSYVEATLCRDD